MAGRASTPAPATEPDTGRAIPGEEAKIPQADRHIDQVLPTHKRWSRIASGIILGVGLLIVAVVLVTGMRDREQAAVRVAPGEDSLAVASALGPPPQRCPTGSLGHLMWVFPPGTPRLTAEADLALLRAGTTHRWVYPAAGQPPTCDPAANATEIGWGADGRVLWIVPVHGRYPLDYDPIEDDSP
jgi:hypothetical protein